MKKIEQEMIKALHENRNWKKGNTEVVIYLNQYGQGLHRKEVYLFDNLIWTSCGCDYYDSYDNCGWDSATTRSRFNALSAEFSGYPHFRIKDSALICTDEDVKPQVRGDVWGYRTVWNIRRL